VDAVKKEIMANKQWKIPYKTQQKTERMLDYDVYKPNHPSTSKA
jgi:hypothetical protein